MVSVVDTSPEADAATLEGLRLAFETIRGKNFDQELSECRSAEEFEGLKEDLELFRDHILVDIDDLLLRVETAAQEENESDSAGRDDDAYDRYKDSRAEAYFADQELSEMLGSLRGDS
ncbi:hypothetical protein NKI61_10640 [Mesorhizobium sp. M0514]|uniref:hypothetical protein n=1 Tax=Mesorhizobium sp. M0514 TaxID=2956955 RepID=UPI00333CECFE